jgi:DNA topoisomerase IA
MTLKIRLSKLEASASQVKHRGWRRVIGDSKEECEAKRRALIESGEALETDRFLFRILV